MFRQPGAQSQSDDCGRIPVDAYGSRRQEVLCRRTTTLLTSLGQFDMISNIKVGGEASRAKGNGFSTPR